MKKNLNLSKQLLKSVLIIYFIITIAVTALHMYVDYRYTKLHIQDELKSIASIFKPAMQTALWDLNEAQLHSIVDGVVKEPLIYKISLKDANNILLLEKIDKQFTKEKKFDVTLSYSFPIYQKMNNLSIHLADITIYSDNIAIFNRLKVGFLMIFFNALIKSAVLILLFMIAFRKRLEIPLQALTKKIDTLKWEHKINRVINVGFVYENELSILQSKFNQLLAKISSEEEKMLELVKTQNIQLEYEVKQRTQELEIANDRLQALAITDTLTKLYNRSKLDEELTVKLYDFNRDAQIFSVIMIDIDFFKIVNDKHGHLIGDYVLREIAKILKNNVRETDVVGRWGGEEFLIICKNITVEGAYLVAENIRHAIEIYNFETVGHKTASFGVSQMKKNYRIEDVIKEADDALYEAKKSGRNKTIKAM